MSFRGWLGIAALVLFTNAGIFLAWDHFFPNYPLLPTNSSSSPQKEEALEELGEEEDTPGIVPASSSVPANDVLEKLMDSWPTMEPEWSSTESVTGVPGTPLDTACPAQEVIVPALSRSQTWLRNEPSPAGVVGQVSAYPAGLGAAAFAEVEQRIAACPEFSQEIAPTLGVQSLVVEGPEEVKTVWFRFGDVVGVVSGKGDEIDIVEMAQGWGASWFPIMTVTSCPQLSSNLSDAERSPLSGNYQGWVRPISADLTQQQEVLADTAGRILAQATSAGTGVPFRENTVPTSGSLTPDTLPSYPSEIAVSLADSPEIPEAPNLPSKPTQDTLSVVAPVPDPQGPGCGWAFTGQEAPRFDSAEAYRKAQEKVAEAQAEQSEQIARWWVAQLRYQVALTRYAEEVRLYNAWVSEATNTIAAAWWKMYDKQLQQWEADYALWESEYAAWEIAMEECQSEPPPPTDDPSTPPTPTPSPTQSCPPEPVQPEPPAEPDLPRPETSRTGD